MRRAALATAAAAVLAAAFPFGGHRAWGDSGLGSEQYRRVRDKGPSWQYEDTTECYSGNDVRRGPGASVARAARPPLPPRAALREDDGLLRPRGAYAGAVARGTRAAVPFARDAANP